MRGLVVILVLLVIGCTPGTDAAVDETTDTTTKAIAEEPAVAEPQAGEDPPAKQEPEWLQAIDLTAFLDSVSTGKMLSSPLVMKFSEVKEYWGYPRHKGIEEVFTTDDGIRWIVLSESTGVGENYLFISYDSDDNVAGVCTLHGPHDVDQTDNEWSYETYSILGNNAFNIIIHHWTMDEEREWEETTESTLRITSEGKFEVVAG